MKPVDPESKALLDSAKPLPIAERVRRLRATAQIMREAAEGDARSIEHMEELLAFGRTADWAAEELWKRYGYEALSMLADICSEIADAPGRVEHFELKIDPSQESPRFKRLELIIRMEDSAQAEEADAAAEPQRRVE